MFFVLFVLFVSGSDSSTLHNVLFHHCSFCGFSPLCSFSPFCSFSRLLSLCFFVALTVAAIHALCCRAPEFVVLVKLVQGLLCTYVLSPLNNEKSLKTVKLKCCGRRLTKECFPLDSGGCLPFPTSSSSSFSSSSSSSSSYTSSYTSSSSSSTCLSSCSTADGGAMPASADKPSCS